MTLNVKSAGLVSTTSAAVSFSRRYFPVSAWPTMYRRAANGVAVRSAPRLHLPRRAVQARQL